MSRGDGCGRTRHAEGHRSGPFRELSGAAGRSHIHVIGLTAHQARKQVGVCRGADQRAGARCVPCAPVIQRPRGLVACGCPFQSDSGRGEVAVGERIGRYTRRDEPYGEVVDVARVPRGGPAEAEPRTSGNGVRIKAHLVCRGPVIGGVDVVERSQAHKAAVVRDVGDVAEGEALTAAKGVHANGKINLERGGVVGECWQNRVGGRTVIAATGIEVEAVVARAVGRVAAAANDVRCVARVRQVAKEDAVPAVGQHARRAVLGGGGIRREILSVRNLIAECHRSTIIPMISFCVDCK